MPRATDSDVQGVITTDSGISLTPFIAVANVITDRVSACATAAGVTLTEAELTQIEIWLAAHFYAIRDQQYQSKRTGDASATFQGKTEMGLNSTFWGQTAKHLDHSGCLARQDQQSQQGGKPKAGATWLGKPPSSQIDYEDRN